MKEDFEKDKGAIWARWEKAQGMPLSQDFREGLEATVEVIAGEEDIALQDLDGLIGDFFEHAAPLIQYFSSRKKPKNPIPKKRYQRCFEKRLYLVEFVMWRHLIEVDQMIANRGRESINWRKRINWKQMCVEWNEAHPNDHMSLEVLKVRYYRAIAEAAIQQEYIERSFIRVPMNVGAELYDYVKITYPEGRERIGNIGSIRRQVENGKFTMDIRLIGDELSSEESSRDAKRASRLLKLSKKWLKAKEAQNERQHP